jgi:hypothetical protein
MHDDLSSLLAKVEIQVEDPEALKFAFAHGCVERVRHLLEDPEVIKCLDALAAYVDGSLGKVTLMSSAEQAAALANRHQGSRSLDGVGHAAVSASYAVANALAGRAVQAADYAAYAAVYGDGGYGATSDPDSFAPEKTWQRALLRQLAGVPEGDESAA